MALKNRTTGKYDCNVGSFKIKMGECVIPEGTKVIESGTFLNCAELEELVIPESLETINPNAFIGCTSLTKITLPDSVETIECWDPRGVFSISLSKPFSDLVDILVNQGYRVRLKEDSWHRWD